MSIFPAPHELNFSYLLFSPMEDISTSKQRGKVFIRC